MSRVACYEDGMCIGHIGQTTWGLIDRSPPADLSPNSRSQHWRKRQKAKKEWKAAGWLMGFRMRGYRERYGLSDIYDRHVVVTYDFTFPDRRRRDMDNLIYMMKPFMDGIVGSKLLKDDAATRVHHGYHNLRHVSGEGPRVEVGIRWMRRAPRS